MTRHRATALFTSLVIALAVTASVAAQANAASDLFVRLQGIVESDGSNSSSPNCANLDAVSCPMSASGTVTCTVCLAGAPTGGTLSLGIERLTSFPPSPCRVKSVSGVFTIAWNDGTSTSVAFDGRFRDGKSILILTGTVRASTSSFISVGAAVKSEIDGFPPSPCVAFTNPITGTISF